ncbi:PRTRC system protein B [Acidithiobacillus caldus ATCC 51756]|jgi:PRTRC genetic system protein B|uniref:PRTRC system protein B n=1 Tax=Acidithiobacillus caldus TaxID=33059 RepID=UPI001C079B2A|nr:PRTRC system protein B [Acidithiobacillus caldus]MBU2736358.1 PRTRC system protein B [Acidithiobacillus caldus ATCC 51756]MBU2802507.1 PRTRC system protein B [Acidithiobacillus caldus]
MEITISDPQRWVLEKAFLLYGCGDEHFLTANDIDGERIGPGKPVSLRGVYALLQKSVQPERFFSFVDARVLYSGPSFLVWWSPPRRRSIHFADHLHDVHGTVIDAAHPGLVWMVKQDGNLTNPQWIAAFKGSRRPTEHTRLYKAPYFNVWDGGNVCQGSGVIPAFTGNAAMMDAWEASFFNSSFTHPNARNVVNHPDDVVGFWRVQLKNPNSRFPTSVLQPLNVTLRTWVMRQIKGDR